MDLLLDQHQFQKNVLSKHHLHSGQGSSKQEN